jgi:hypothetical protein
MIIQADILFTTTSRPALGPTKPPVQWVPRCPPCRWSGQGVKLTTPLSSAEFWKRGAIPPLPHTSAWRGAKLSKKCYEQPYKKWGRCEGAQWRHARVLVYALFPPGSPADTKSVQDSLVSEQRVESAAWRAVCCPCCWSPYCPQRTLCSPQCR